MYYCGDDVGALLNGHNDTLMMNVTTLLLLWKKRTLLPWIVISSTKISYNNSSSSSCVAGGVYILLLLWWIIRLKTWEKHNLTLKEFINVFILRILVSLCITAISWNVWTVSKEISQSAKTFQPMEEFLDADSIIKMNKTAILLLFRMSFYDSICYMYVSFITQITFRNAISRRSFLVILGFLLCHNIHDEWMCRQHLFLGVDSTVERAFFWVAGTGSPSISHSARNIFNSFRQHDCNWDVCGWRYICRYLYNNSNCQVPNKCSHTTTITVLCQNN